MAAPIFTLGCDPELFIKGPDGSNVSAHDLIPGDKKAPHRVGKGAIQRDGLAAEFNTDPVAISDFEAFNGNILAVLGDLKSALPAGYTLNPIPTVVFDSKYYEGIPADAKVLGCDPDYCAYSTDIFEPNPRPDGDSGLRSAAGHIHIGWGSDIPTDHPEHMNVCRSIIRQLDWYVGLGMAAIDTDGERRKLYGKAGAYRPKSYGVEYRTPSNAWLISKSYRFFIHSLVNRAVTDMRKGSGYTAETRFSGLRSAQDIINSGDQKAAIAFLKNSLGVMVPTAPKA